MRMGKDSFFYGAMVVGLVLLRNNFRRLPQFESLTLTFFLILGYLNQVDFLMPATFYQFTFFGAGVLAVYLMYCKTEYDFEDYILNILFFSALLHVSWIAAEALGFKPYRIYANLLGGVSYKSASEDSMVVGILNHPNMSGAYLALCIPAFLRKKERFCFIPLVLWAIAMLDSIMPLATATAVIGYAVICNFLQSERTNFLYILAAVAMVVAYFTGLGGHDNQRFEIWRKGIEMFGGLSLFGKGVGWFADIFHLKIDGHIGTARQEHNEFLSLYFAYGLTGIGLAGAMFYRAAKDAGPIFGAGLFGVFINCYGNFPFHLSTLAMVCIFYYTASLKKSLGGIYD